MIIGLIATALWVVTVVGYVIVNLYRKNVKLESAVLDQQELIGAIQRLIAESDRVIKQLDDKIWMESEKDIAAAVQSMREIQIALNKFKGK